MTEQLIFFVAAGPQHEIAQRFVGILAMIKDKFHLLGDGHFDAQMPRQAHRGAGGANAFGNLAVEAGEDIAELASSAQFEAYGAIA